MVNLIWLGLFGVCNAYYCWKFNMKSSKIRAGLVSWLSFMSMIYVGYYIKKWGNSCSNTCVLIYNWDSWPGRGQHDKNWSTDHRGSVFGACFLYLPFDTKSLMSTLSFHLPIHMRAKAYTPAIIEGCQSGRWRCVDNILLYWIGPTRWWSKISICNHAYNLLAKMKELWHNSFSTHTPWRRIARFYSISNKTHPFRLRSILQLSQFAFCIHTSDLHCNCMKFGPTCLQKMLQLWT